MRNLKKILALVLALVMTASATAMVSADFTDVDADNVYATAINALAAEGVIAGYGDTFGPDQDVTRWQMALFMARAATGITDDASWKNGVIPFADIEGTSANYKGAISFAFVNGIIKGRDAANTTFDPDAGITYRDALVMAVRALGYDDGNIEYKMGYFSVAAKLGLTDGVEVYDLGQALTRAETAQIIYNMIYVVPADGSDTMYDKNFAEVVEVRDETLFVITATPKQFFAEGYAANKTDTDVPYVGIQAVVNGLPTGEITYLPAAELNIDPAKVEDYFAYAVNLINYDAETGDYEDAVLGEAPAIVNYTNVTKVSGTTNKIKVGNNTYTLVGNFTDATLRNEILIFDGGVDVQTAKFLLTDADGNIIDINGTVQARLVLTNTTAKYYAVTDGGTTTLITEAEALAEFGIPNIIGDELDYARYSTVENTGAFGEVYQLTMFDDDKDGLYERAFYAPIYMSSYYVSANGDEVVNNAALNNAASKTVTYSDDSVKVPGTFFKFTYNKQLNKINVIEKVGAYNTGKLDKVVVNKLSDDAADTNITVIIDGKTYYLAKDAQYSFDVETATLGAIFLPRTGTASIANVANGSHFNWCNAVDFIFTAKIDQEYKFYTINDRILHIEAVTAAPETYDFYVMKGVAGMDLNEIYADLYVDGALKTNAPIYAITTYGKVADLDFIKFAYLMTNTSTTWAKQGTVYASQVIDGEYNLVDVITKTTSDALLAKYGLIELDADTIGTDSMIAFLGGTTVYIDNDAQGASYNANFIDLNNRIRTDANTVFYFIDTTIQVNSDPFAAEVPGIVKIFKGIPADGAKITLDSDSVVYVDKLGYTGTGAGVAGTVIVFDADFEGFTITVSDDKYLATFGLTAANLVNGGLTSAERLGLTGTDYAGKYFYAYTGAVNIETGVKQIIYSEYKLNANEIYKTDKNGVVLNTYLGSNKNDTDHTVSAVFGLTQTVNAGILYAHDNAQLYAYTNADGYIVVERPVVPADEDRFLIDATQKLTGLIGINTANGNAVQGAAAMNILSDTFADVISGKTTTAIYWNDVDAITSEPVVINGVLVFLYTQA